MTDRPDTRVWKLPEKAPSPVEFAQAWSRVVTSAADMMRASGERAAQGAPPLPYDPAAPFKAFSGFAAHMLTDPAYALKVQQDAASDWLQLMTAAATRAGGGTTEPVIAPERGDRRFADPAWSEEPIFDYLKQAYLLASKRMVDAVAGAEGLDEGPSGRLCSSRNRC
jgi:polyhydroxyalkanoate synthase